jgi:hypothetical protein
MFMFTKNPVMSYAAGRRRTLHRPLVDLLPFDDRLARVVTPQSSQSFFQLEVEVVERTRPRRHPWRKRRPCLIDTSRRVGPVIKAIGQDQFRLRDLR